jgi:hypothetical protein
LLEGGGREVQMISPADAGDLCFTYNIYVAFDAWQPIWIVLISEPAWSPYFQGL